MSIEMKFQKIIPPADYQHRNGFDNRPLIDELTEEDKKELEDFLIHKLLFESVGEVDTLIVETLAHLNSQKSIPILKDILAKCNYAITKLRIARCIYEINHDRDMISISVSAFRELESNKGPYNVYGLIDSFYELAKFRVKELEEIIAKYTNDEEHLISYNAKRALSYNWD